MNTHFVLFLLDLFVWSLLGILIGKKIHAFESDNKRGEIRTLLIYLGIAIFTGLFVVLCNGLPESGFAFNDLLYVLFVIFAYTLATSSKVRKRLFRFHRKSVGKYSFIGSQPKGVTLIHTR